MRQAVGVVALLLLLLGCGSDEEDRANAAEAQAARDRGWAAYLADRYDQALLEFERATRLDPDLADGWNGLGWSRLKLVQGAPEERVIAAAEEAFREALRRDPELADGWLGLAQVRFLRRESPADLLTALEAIRAARQADPSSLFRHDYRSWADVYALEGWCYYYLGDPDAARDRLRRALQEDPSQPAALRLQAQLP